ncbi:MAG: hypothetical protein WD278_00050 [Pirellulales bacterium]
MSLEHEVRRSLEALAPFSLGSHTLAAAAGDQRLECDLTALDRLACEFTRFELASQRLSQAGIDELKRVSEALSKRLTYLLEPISPIEVDAQQCVVQLRSNPPARDEQATSYYELLVRRGGHLSLARWVKDAGNVRRPLPAQVTRQVLLRLVGDFSAVAG